jgi:hypothetical protein
MIKMLEKMSSEMIIGNLTLIKKIFSMISGSMKNASKPTIKIGWR